MIIVKLQGGLGNQMFQYAIGRKLSMLNKTTLKLDLSFLLDRTTRENFEFREYDLDIFALEPYFATYQDLKNFVTTQGKGIKTQVYKYLVNPFLSQKYIKENSFSFNSNILSLTGNLYLDGYWQSPLYFEDIKAEIKKDFRYISANLPEQGEHLLTLIKANQSVCLHVRRGDFVYNTTNSKVHGFVGLDYIQTAMERMTNIISSPIFIVFSDDINWCLENIKTAHSIIFVSRDYLQQKVNYNRKLELSNTHYLMQSCKHFVISNSTFSWWAAWLSNHDNKIVIYPKKWFNDSSINTSDLMPSEWIQIP
jgi:hypothetical protein